MYQQPIAIPRNSYCQLLCWDSNSHASQANSTGTHLSKKVSTHSYASEAKDRVKMNEELAKKMCGHFLGAMPPLAFLDRFLPLKPGLDSLDNQRSKLKGAFDAVGDAKSVHEMYKPFVEAVKPFVRGITFVDTHSRFDIERDKLAPDIAGYDQHNLPDEDATTDFAKMSTFAELKHSTDADPFCDPYDFLPPQTEFRFERDAAIPVRDRGQIGSCSAALCGSQFRVYLFSVSICGKTARFIRWDRSGAIVSRSFNYVDYPEILASFFWRYSHLDRRQQGYDPTVSPASVEEIKSAELLEQRLRAANPQHREFQKVMVPDHVDADQDKAFIISFPPSYDISSPFSKATRAMLAFDLTAKKLVFLKDYWRADVSGMDKEGDIYAILQKANVPNIAPFGTGNDVKDHVTLTQTLRNERWACWTSEMIYLRQYRMTLDVIGRKLTAFSSSWEFVSAIADAMEAHDHAFFDAKILHRDTSVGNILITNERKGLLINWDLCDKINPEVSVSTGRRRGRIGTRQFSSIALLRARDPYASHVPEDDQESSLYVLVWTALRYREHGTHTQPPGPSSPGTTLPTEGDVACVLQAFDDVYTDNSDTLSGVVKVGILLGGDLSRVVQFDEYPKLGALVCELEEVLKVRYEGPPDKHQFDMLEEMKAIGISEDILRSTVAYDYLTRSNKLRTKGWLVETIRAHLTGDDQPVDDAEPQRTTPQTGSKRKMKADQASLDGRVPKKHSSSV